MTQLHNELMELARHLSPTPREAKLRKEAVAQLEELSKELFPDSRLEVFGSAATGLCLPGSDVDVVLLKAPSRAIYRLAAALRTRRMVDEIEVIASARVPIIKFTWRGNPVEIDVCFEEEGGPRTTEFIRGVLDVFPEVRPLTLAVKLLLAQRDLNSTHRGGMGSYLCFLTVLAYVQRARRATLVMPSAGKAAGSGSLGALLIGYLDFFGNVLNMEEVGVSLLEGGSLFRKRDRGWLSEERSFLLAMENPENPDMDVGKNSREIRTVRRAFQHAHRVLSVAALGAPLQPPEADSGSARVRQEHPATPSSSSILARVLEL